MYQHNIYKTKLFQPLQSNHFALTSLSLNFTIRDYVHPQASAYINKLKTKRPYSVT